MSKKVVLNIAIIAKLKSITLATLESRFLYLLLIAVSKFFSSSSVDFAFYDF